MNYWKKFLFKKLIRITPQYHRYRKRIGRRIAGSDLDLYNIIRNTPYYKEQKYHKDKIENYPFLTRFDVSGREKQFIPVKIKKTFLLKGSTGGSSGNPLKFYRTLKDVIKEEAYVNYSFSLIGKNLKIAVLRGNRPSSGIYEYKYGHLLLSSYSLSKENVSEYIKLIKRYKINCLHVYPSSIQIFCKYLKELLRENSIELPKLKGIVSASEILTAEVKEDILKLFPNITLIDQYGQNEHVAFAISVNKGYYHFYDSYSTVEFLDTGITNGNNKIKEIVGTNLNNKAMPLIRYRTGDFAEIDENGNVIAIIGRTNDFVVNVNNEIQPCIVVTNAGTLENVIAFQYYQDKIGELIFKVKVNKKFCDTDIKKIQEDIGKCFHGLMKIHVEVVNDFERTNSGKHIRVVQKLNVNTVKF